MLHKTCTFYLSNTQKLRGEKGGEGRTSMASRVSKNNIHRTPFTVICLALIAVVLCAAALAFFSDNTSEQAADAGAGTVIVKLVEEEPFDDKSTHPPEGWFIDHKTFRGQSLGMLDTYIRAYLKPVVEAYDETMEEWILIPVSGRDISLEVAAGLPASGEGTWVGTDLSGAKVADLSDALFFYYTKILREGELTTDLRVQIADINLPEQFLNMEIRYNLHVFIEGAQVKSSLWKKIFNIENLSAGVER